MNFYRDFSPAELLILMLAGVAIGVLVL